MHLSCLTTKPLYLILCIANPLFSSLFLRQCLTNNFHIAGDDGRGKGGRVGSNLAAEVPGQAEAHPGQDYLALVGSC